MSAHARMLMEVGVTDIRMKPIAMRIPVYVHPTPEQLCMPMMQIAAAATQNTNSTMFRIIYAFMLAKRRSFVKRSVDISYARTTRDLIDYSISLHKLGIYGNECRTRRTTAMIQTSVRERGPPYAARREIPMTKVAIAKAT